MNIPLRDFSELELKKEIAGLGEKPFRAAQLAGWLYKKAALTFEEITNLPAPFKEKLKARFCVNSLSLVSKDISAEDHSVKYLLRTQDSHLLETVLILQGKRRTICLSTQIGCKMGCRFCASGKEGMIRHLSAGEILDQIAWVNQDQQCHSSNLVYMGMGEPLDNYDHVLKSIRAAGAPWGYEIGQRRITVSTVGVIPGIRKLARENLNQLKLSFSLHSPDNAVRAKLIPSNRKYQLDEIIDALKQVRDQFKRKITLEYILIEELTDRDEDAQGLAKICLGLKAKVNLIPYNRIEDEAFKRPSREKIQAFQQELEKAGIRVTVRYSAGQDIDAACGQLRLREERKARPKRS